MIDCPQNITLVYKFLATVCVFMALYGAIVGRIDVLVVSLVVAAICAIASYDKPDTENVKENMK